MMFLGTYGLLVLLYFVVLEATRGQTLGKMLTGIKVVKQDGSPCDFSSSLIRNLLRVVDGIFVYVVGALFIAQSDKDQRLGDRIANTVVVST
ncbi:hypothetical protein C9439_02305 [archaeon SCG-AAA382B04]|nr:hypothetical protein C9439_02305 [archaeon SCG-AAA382B04]